MPHRVNRKPSPAITSEDAKTEGIIDALRYLADEAEREDLPAYHRIIDEAFKRCLVHYVAEKKGGLTTALEQMLRPRLGSMN